MDTDLRSMAPGLGLAAAAVAISWLVSAFTGPTLGILIVAIILGVIVANVRPLSEQFRPGLHFCSKTLLRIGVMLLGLAITIEEVSKLGWEGLALLIGVVAGTFVITNIVGRMFSLQRATTVLIATGTAICGASAVAAMSTVLPDKDEEVDDGAAVAIASVTLYGTVALLVMPLLAGPLGLDSVAYGAWVGGSVHEVGQVVAAAAPIGESAPNAAIIVKLTRVLLLAPLVAIMAIYLRRSATSTGKADGGRPTLVRRS